MVDNVLGSWKKWTNGDAQPKSDETDTPEGGGMPFVAEELMRAAKLIAEDPFAESPFMERGRRRGTSNGRRYGLKASPAPLRC